MAPSDLNAFLHHCVYIIYPNVHLIVVTWARVFCLICTPESQGLQAQGMRVYISGRTQVHMLQLLCTTLIVSG